MGSNGSLVGGVTLGNFLTGFFSTAVLVMAVGVGMEVGAASAGAAFDRLSVAALVLGGVTSILGLVYVRRNY